MAFLAAAAPILGAVGAGVSAIGQISQGESAVAEARYRSQIAANNRVIEEQNAQYATRAGEEATFQTGLRERDKAAKITTGIAANNLDVNTGSARDVRASQAEIGQQAEETTKNNAELTAYGYRTQATNYQAESKLLRAEAPQDVAGGFLGGAGVLLSGASTAGFRWNQIGAPAPTI